MSTPTRPEMVGRTLMSKLKVLRVLGAGGMGTVYEVEHLITRHHRALKVLHPQHGESHETVARFIREAGVAGTLKTPYVVETYDAGTMEDGSAYVLMELLSGMPLSSLVERGEPVPAGRIVGVACQILEGLSVAHEAGVIHRDVKPDNIFLVRDEKGRERVKLLDFGISKFTQGVKDYAGTLTSEGTMMGTPYYMSPEQASGTKDIDARTDLYSMGIILYEALAGHRPFDGQTLAALVIRIHKGECEPLSTVAPMVGPGLAGVVHKAMSADRAERYRSAREMLAALIPYADSGYVATLDTLRESVAEAATLRRDSMPLLEGRSVPTSPGSGGPARVAARRAEDIDLRELDVTQDAIAASLAARPKRGRVIAIAAATAALLGIGAAIAWATAGGAITGDPSPEDPIPGDVLTGGARGVEVPPITGPAEPPAEAAPEPRVDAPPGADIAVPGEAEASATDARPAITRPRVPTAERDAPAPERRHARPEIERDNPY